jgi:hypothetical protein
MFDGAAAIRFVAAIAAVAAITSASAATVAITTRLVDGDFMT